MIGYIILSLIVMTLGWTTFNLTRKVERLETAPYTRHLMMSFPGQGY